MFKKKRTSSAPMSDVSIEPLRPFFCGAPYDNMLLIHRDWYDSKGTQQGWPVRVNLRYRFDVRDAPSRFADLFGKEAFIRTYIRDFKLQKNGLQVRRIDQQIDGDFYNVVQFFPLRDGNAAKLMTSISELTNESLSGEIWTLATRAFSSHAPARYAE